MHLNKLGRLLLRYSNFKNSSNNSSGSKMSFGSLFQFSRRDLRYLKVLTLGLLDRDLRFEYWVSEETKNRSPGLILGVQGRGTGTEKGD